MQIIDREKRGRSCLRRRWFWSMKWSGEVHRMQDPLVGCVLRQNGFTYIVTAFKALILLRW